MNRNVIGGAIAVIVVIFLLIFGTTRGWFKGNDNVDLVNLCPPPSDTQVVVGTIVSSDSLIRMYEAIAGLKAEKKAYEKCFDQVPDNEPDNDLMQENAKLRTENKKLRAEIDYLKKKGSGSSSKTKTVKQTDGQNVRINETQPDRQDVTNIYSPTTPGAQEISVNVRTGLNGHRDSGSFWPHLEGNPPTSVVREAVLNSSGDGWNIKLPPVNEIGGLYGWSDNLRVIFVKADILDKFGPTNVSMAGGMNNWPKIWAIAQRETINGVEYYVAHY